MSLNRRHALQALALAAGGMHIAGRAQGSATKILVGFPPSGLPDMVARALADPLGRTLGVPVLVDNRPGANGRLAAQAVKAAAPDGRTLLITPASGMVHLPHVYKNLGYDPFADFAPIAQLVENDFAFTISPKIPAKTLAEFVAWCRKNPDLATYGSPGLGSAPHLMGATLIRDAGAPMRHVPYRGNNYAITDMSGGHITAMFSATTFVTPGHKAGLVRVLATTGQKRSTGLPDVPTFAELGLKGMTIVEGTWLMAPAKTPPAVVEKLASAAIAACRSPQMNSALQGQAVAAPLGPVALAAVMREEYDRRGAAIRAAGFTAND
jgi:tripartite-type tricarboxylate transporter receptor subunit TctC